MLKEESEESRTTIIRSPGGFRIGSVLRTLGGFYRGIITEIPYGSTTMMPFATFAEAEAWVREKGPQKV